MHSSWLVVIPKSNDAGLRARVLLEQHALSRLSFHPDRVWFQSLKSGALIFTAAANARAFGLESTHDFGNERVLVFSGLPTLEYWQMQPREDFGRQLHRLLVEYGPNKLHEHAGGEWSIARVSEDGGTAFASFSGYDSFYYIDSRDLLAVSNRASLLAPLVQRDGRVGYNIQAISWLFSTTMIYGRATAFNGVSKVPSGHYLLFTLDGEYEIKSHNVTYFTPPDSPQETEHLIDSAVQRLSSRISWYCDRGIEIVAHLTGGKDSRTLLALLLHSGAVERIRSIDTYGSETHGDVIVARRVAEAIGLENRHVVHDTGSNIGAVLDPISVERRFLYCGPCYEAQLTPYDGSGDPAVQPSPIVTLMGGGGEIYRQKNHVIPLPIDPRAAFVHFKDWQCPFDPLGILDPDVRAWQLDQLRAMVSELAQTTTNLHPRFYIEQRLSNWGAAHFRNEGLASLAVLIDLPLARAMQSASDMGENIHFELMRRAYPELLRVPFLNHGWEGITAARAERLQAHYPPIQVATERSFPWQYRYYREYRNTLIDIVLRHPSLMSGVVSWDSLLKLRRTEVEPFGSPHVKVLFGLVMACVTISDRSSSTSRHFMDAHRTTFSGNLGNAFVIVSQSPLEPNVRPFLQSTTKDSPGILRRLGRWLLPFLRRHGFPNGGQ